MKVLILAGGRGTRLAPDTDTKPKPLIRVGDRAIVWHIMRHYAHYGFRDFMVALGHQGEAIRNAMAELDEPWQVNCVDTGVETQTGGRIKRLLANTDRQTCFLTYGDGIADVDLHALRNFHQSHGRLVTLTAVQPTPRFGRITLAGDQVTKFAEKRDQPDEWVNGGFFVVEPEVVNYIDGDESSWESDALPRLAQEGQLMAYRHRSFWQCMDTPAERLMLEELWQQPDCPWRLWE